MKKKKFSLILLIFTLFLPILSGQAYLHTQGKNIVDGEGNNFILRSIGTGNWMLQEGYMMQTSGVAGTQHEFRNRLEQMVGTARTDSFYTKWLDDHFTKRDADSLASWGFNAIRVALHYKWFTLPIEDEPVVNEQTWLEDGFNRLDSLLSWCAANQMYLILDMHGAPGGQGKESNISDYDDTKLSLWESPRNKTKLVALWYKLAERYSDESWIGGYDLINETNWTFPEGNNSQLRNIYERITDTIRLVDQNHIIYIEGNWFANDFSGLTPPWDDNMVYSFHKYWSYNNDNSLNWVINMRNAYNVPLWLGETGENSNTWFTGLVALAEKNNIGWSWWPVKKPGINNPFRVNVNQDYTNLVNYWKGQAAAPTADAAFQAVMQFAENHRVENCKVQKDVMDALFRQPFEKEIKAYKIYSPEDIIYAVDYALGRVGYAYFDFDTADYHGDTDEYTAWNQGYQYRNDGVDIETCNDQPDNCGYSIGWTSTGEWMIYTLHSDSAALYDIEFRSASNSGGSYLVLEANGKVISDRIPLPHTGGWANWKTSTATDILLPDGEIHLKVKFVQGGSNLNYFRFKNPRNANSAAFIPLHGETSTYGNEIILHLNKKVSSQEVLKSDFRLKINTTEVIIDTIAIAADSLSLIITPLPLMKKTDLLFLSYSGETVVSNGENLSPFENKKMTNSLAEYFTIPAKIEAERFFVNQGLELETCKDTGGGFNTGYANPGDYLDYIINVPASGTYNLDLRVALQNGNAFVDLLYDKNGVFQFIKTVTLLNTGGWQTWKTQSHPVNLPAGKYRFRIRVNQGEHNLNWISFGFMTSVPEKKPYSNPVIYPNPADQYLHISLPGTGNEEFRIQILDVKGEILSDQKVRKDLVELPVGHLTKGIYIVRISGDNRVSNHKIIIN